MNELYELLCSINPKVDYWNEQHLIDERVYDSMQTVYLLSQLCCMYDIQIEPQDMVPENFNSMQAIWELVQQYRSQKHG